MKYCRSDKVAQFTPASLSDELADVMVCTLSLAEIFDVDLPAAVTGKIDFLRTRRF